MTLDEIRAAKQALEDEIRELLSPRFDEFAKKTGCPIDGMSVRLLWTQSFGERIGQSHVTQVDLSIQTGL